MLEEQKQDAPETDADEQETTPDNQSVTMKQSDLNKLFAARKLQAEQSILKSLGLPSLDAAKQLVGEARKKDEAQLSELQKAQKDIDALKQERDSLATQIQQFKAQSAIRAAGSDYPELLAAHIPIEALDDERALEKALDKLKEEYPPLFVRRTAGSVDGGAGRTDSRPNTQNMNAMIRRAAGRD